MRGDRKQGLQSHRSMDVNSPRRSLAARCLVSFCGRFMEPWFWSAPPYIPRRPNVVFNLLFFLLNRDAVW